MPLLCARLFRLRAPVLVLCSCRMATFAKAEVVELVREVFAEVAAEVCDAVNAALARTHHAGQPRQQFDPEIVKEIRNVARGTFSDAYAAVTHALFPPSKRTSSDAPDGPTPAHKRARPDDSELHTAPAQADGTVARAPLPRAAKMPTALSPAPHGASAGTTKMAAAKDGAAQPAQPAQPAQRHKGPSPICRLVTVSRHKCKVMYDCQCSDGSTRRRDFGDLKREHDSARLLALLSDFVRSEFLAEGGANDALRRTVLAHISSTLQCTPHASSRSLCVRAYAHLSSPSYNACSSRRSSSR
jgi:hypothetical protein